MKQQKTIYREVRICLTPEKYEKVQQLMAASTCRRINQYIRQVALQEPVTIKYQDENTGQILSAINSVSRSISAIAFELHELQLRTLRSVNLRPADLQEVALATGQGKDSLHELSQQLHQIRAACLLIYDSPSG
ncbi:hypothetical protein [Niabella terrae]